MDGQGLHGIIIQKEQRGAPIGGFFGLSVQLGTNLAVLAKDEAAGNIGSATLEIIYTHNSVLTREVISYNSTILYQRSLPVNTGITVKMYGPGYLTYTSTFTLVAGEFKTLSIVLPFAYINVRRY